MRTCIPLQTPSTIHEKHFSAFWNFVRINTRTHAHAHKQPETEGDLERHQQAGSLDVHSPVSSHSNESDGQENDDNCTFQSIQEDV